MKLPKLNKNDNYIEDHPVLGDIRISKQILQDDEGNEIPIYLASCYDQSREAILNYPAFRDGIDFQEFCEEAIPALMQEYLSPTELH